MEERKPNVEEIGDRIVRSIIGGVFKDKRMEKLVVRIIRATGDLDLIGTLRVSSNLFNTVEKVKYSPVIVDTKMAKAALGEMAIYFEPPPGSKFKASSSIMRAVDSGDVNSNPVLISTSPIALMTLLREVEKGRARPPLVIGVPVGFVNAVKAKMDLIHSGLEYVTNLSVRGGVGLGVAIARALLVQFS